MRIHKAKFLFQSPTIYFVEGYIRGIIYDFSRNKQYWIGPLEQEIIKNCKEPISQLALIKKAQDYFPDVEISKIKRYLKQFKKRKLIMRTKDTTSSTKKNEPSIITNPKINKFWCELTLKCNSKCLHCYACANSDSGEDLDEDFSI